MMEKEKFLRLASSILKRKLSEDELEKLWAFVSEKEIEPARVPRFLRCISDAIRELHGFGVDIPEALAIMRTADEICREGGCRAPSLHFLTHYEHLLKKIIYLFGETKNYNPTLSDILALLRRFPTQQPKFLVGKLVSYLKGARF